MLIQDDTQSFCPPAAWVREQVLAASDAVLGMPAGAVNESEDIFRLCALGLDWDIGVRVYAPAANIARSIRWCYAHPEEPWPAPGRAGDRAR